MFSVVHTMIPNTETTFLYLKRSEMTDYKICVILIKETNWFDEPIMYYIFKGVPTNMSRPFEKILVD